jgi:hypothetical protein
MNMEHVPTQATMGARQHDEAARRLHGHWLLLARMVWLAIFVLTLVVFCANLAVGSYGLVTTILVVAVTNAYFAVSLVLFWRRSTDRFILLISFNLFLVGGVIIQPYPNPLEQWNWVWVLPILFLEFLAWSAFSVLYMFPDGRFIPRWTRWLALGWIAIWLMANLPFSIPGAFYPWNWWSSPLITVVQVAYFCSLMLALLYRYRRVSTPVQRQQIKWVVFATTVSFLEASVAYPVLFILRSYYPALGSSSLLFQLVVLITTVLSVLVPLSIGFALLRYRLWDIDIIINRTLVYGTLTASLALVYFGLVFVMQFLMRGLIGQTNDVAIVVSTLVIAALFQPLRQHIQAIIDRRFYRRKYDAAKTLAAFSATLRNEVDLDDLSRQLVAVVQETMQPSHVSLWLRKAKPESKLPATV